MLKSYIFFANGLEEIEGLTVVDLLRRAGIDISIVSMNPTLTVTGAHNIVITADLLFNEIDAESASLFVLPGGLPGTTYLAENKALGQILTQAALDGKYVAAICAAPSVLGGLGLLQGKNATCYPGWEDRLTGAVPKTDHVVIDGNIITSRGMGTAIEFAAALVGLLKNSKKAEEDLKRSVVFEY